MRKIMASGMICLAVLAGALSAAAQELPQLFSVTGVDADDELNIRAEPSARGALIGALAHDATGIEVMALNTTRRWGQINIAEGAGWVAMNYLQAEGRHIDHFNLPVGLRCFGTEPFWSLVNADGALEFEMLGNPPQSLTIEIAQDSGIADDMRRMILMSGPEGIATAYMHPEMCNDGMSDRLYGLSIAFMEDSGAALLTGCCSLSR